MQRQRATSHTSAMGLVVFLALTGGAFAQGESDFPPDVGGPSMTYQESWGKIHGITVEVRGLLSIPVTGDAGAGTASPAFGDAFGMGLGANVKIGFALTRALGLRLDLGAVSYPGKKFDSAGTSNLFSDMNTAHILVGIDLILPLNVETKVWFDFDGDKTWTGLAVGLSIGGGAQYTDHVRWIEPKPAWSYWDSSVGGLFVARLGLLYRVTRTFGFTLEGEACFADPSPEAGRSGARASAGGMWTIGLGAGLNLVF